MSTTPNRYRDTRKNAIENHKRVKEPAGLQSMADWESLKWYFSGTFALAACAMLPKKTRWLDIEVSGNSRHGLELLESSIGHWRN